MNFSVRYLYFLRSFFLIKMLYGRFIVKWNYIFSFKFSLVFKVLVGDKSKIIFWMFKFFFVLLYFSDVIFLFCGEFGNILGFLGCMMFVYNNLI